MDLLSFCHQSHLRVVAGKGGVGKTTVTAALARMAAAAGMDVLIVALESTSALAGFLGHPGLIGYEDVRLEDDDIPGSLSARVITPDDALLEYLAEHGMRRVSRRLVASGAIEVVATAIPGIREILVLGKVKQLERAPAGDLIVLDAPAAGHAVTFLTSALGLLDAARGGPVRSQAQEVVELLTDAERCQVLLVTIPEETPVNELVETAHRLEHEAGVALGPIIVNCCYDVLDGLDEDPAAAARSAGVPPPGRDLASRLKEAAEWRVSRQDVQEQQIARLAVELPLDQLRLPYVFGSDIGPEQISFLADRLADGVRRVQGEAPKAAGGA